MRFKLAAPEALNVKGNDGKIYTGGSQEWYTDSWHIKAGCGPTVASNLIWYIESRQPELKLCRREDGGQGSFVELMDEMITFITPTLRGVNTPAIFYEGFIGYGEKRGVKFVPHVLEIPCKASKRPEPDVICEFILAALQADSPVAFLNLSNGTLKNLENWHWVTVIALEPDSMATDICDQGNVLTIDLGEWLRTTMLGGALVYMALA